MAEHGDDHGLTGCKQALRERVRTARDAIPAVERRRKTAAIEARCATFLNAPGVRSVFTYLSTEFEVGTHGLVDRLLRRGKTVLVPRIDRHRGMEMVVFPGWNALKPATLGILSPPATLPAHSGTPDCAILPGLAFCSDGRRLGYGGGYYDRWLARHPDCLAVAIAFEQQLVPDLPCGPYDVPVRRIETEMRSIRRVPGAPGQRACET